MFPFRGDTTARFGTVFGTVFDTGFDTVFDTVFEAAFDLRAAPARAGRSRVVVGIEGRVFPRPPPVLVVPRASFRPVRTGVFPRLGAASGKRPCSDVRVDDRRVGDRGVCFGAAVRSRFAPADRSAPLPRAALDAAFVGGGPPASSARLRVTSDAPTGASGLPLAT